LQLPCSTHETVQGIFDKILDKEKKMTKYIKTIE